MPSLEASPSSAICWLAVVEQIPQPPRALSLPLCEMGIMPVLLM